MTVGVIQRKINEIKDISEKLSECVKRVHQEDNKDELKSLEKYGITLDLLVKAWQLLDTTAQNLQEDLDNCEVNCKC